MILLTRKVKNNMASFEYTITDELGIHARPAGDLVKLASTFQDSEITIQKGDSTGDLKRIFSIMGLSVTQGETIKVEVKGGDEEATAKAIEDFFKANL